MCAYWCLLCSVFGLCLAHMNAIMCAGNICAKRTVKMSTHIYDMFSQVWTNFIYFAGCAQQLNFISLSLSLPDVCFGWIFWPLLACITLLVLAPPPAPLPGILPRSAFRTEFRCLMRLTPHRRLPFFLAPISPAWLTSSTLPSSAAMQLGGSLPDPTSGVVKASQVRVNPGELLR